MSLFVKYLQVFLLSMVPLVELRGAIPLAQALGLPVLQSYLVCILGNMLPVPLIYCFAVRVLERGRDKRLIGKFCEWCIKKGQSARDKLLAKVGKNGIFVALLLFVGIPLPGTGAWTGTLAASFLEVGGRKTSLAVGCGILLAGVIMMAASVAGISLIR